MDLEDFIKTSLKSIYLGVTGSNKEIFGEELGKSESSVFVIMHGDKESIVEFDIAVTAEASSKKEGKAGLKIHVAELGGGVNSSQSEQKVSRIKFRVKALSMIG